MSNKGEELRCEKKAGVRRIAKNSRKHHRILKPPEHNCKRGEPPIKKRICMNGNGQRSAVAVCVRSPRGRSLNCKKSGGRKKSMVEFVKFSQIAPRFLTLDKHKTMMYNNSKSQPITERSVLKWITK